MYIVLNVPIISSSCQSLCRNIMAHVNEVERTNELISDELLTIQAELSRILENISPSPPLPLLPPSPPTPPPSPLQPPHPTEGPPSPLVPPEVVHAYRHGIYEEHWILILWVLLCTLSMYHCCCSSSRPNRFKTMN